MLGELLFKTLAVDVEVSETSELLVLARQQVGAKKFADVLQVTVIKRCHQQFLLLPAKLKCFRYVMLSNTLLYQILEQSSIPKLESNILNLFSVAK